jgi:hypothetical protein
MAQIAAITLNTRGTANGASANTIVYNPVSPYLQPEKGYDTKRAGKTWRRTSAFTPVFTR